MMANKVNFRLITYRMRVFILYIPKLSQAESENLPEDLIFDKAEDIEKNRKLLAEVQAKIKKNIEELKFVENKKLKERIENKRNKRAQSKNPQ